MVRCMDASIDPQQSAGGLAALDVQILHSVNHRDREKSLADLCLMLNIEDTHLVTYAVKKLQRMKLVTARKRGKEKMVAVTKTGAAACERYKQVRETLLVSSVKSLGLNEEDVSRVAALLRALSGQYDQAARGAASL
jgi:predicted MarR family transcription regulator